jgi:hypothetical protein
MFSAILLDRSLLLLDWLVKEAERGQLLKLVGLSGAATLEQTLGEAFNIVAPGLPRLALQLLEGMCRSASKWFTGRCSRNHFFLSAHHRCCGEELSRVYVKRSGIREASPWGRQDIYSSHCVHGGAIARSL